MGVDSRVSNVGLRAFGAKAVTDVLNLCAKLISLIWFILKLFFERTAKAYIFPSASVLRADFRTTLARRAPALRAQ